MGIPKPGNFWKRIPNDLVIRHRIPRYSWPASPAQPVPPTPCWAGRLKPDALLPVPPRLDEIAVRVFSPTLAGASATEGIEPTCVDIRLPHQQPVSRALSKHFRAGPKEIASGSIAAQRKRRGSPGPRWGLPGAGGHTGGAIVSGSATWAAHWWGGAGRNVGLFARPFRPLGGPAAQRGEQEAQPSVAEPHVV